MYQGMAPVGTVSFHLAWTWGLAFALLASALPTGAAQRSPEYYALSTLYHTLGGGEWSTKVNWLSGGD